MVAKIKSKPKNKLWIYFREFYYAEDRIIVIWPDGKIAKIRINDDGKA